MAIFNSIVLGKSKGSIGNVTTTTLKGQSVAKQRNFNPANPRTVLQVNSRGKMSNAVKAWQFAALFFAMSGALKKPLESIYNMFIRLTKNAYTTVVEGTGALAFGLLSGYKSTATNFVNITSINAVTPEVVVVFTTGGLAYDATAHVRTMQWVAETGANKITDRIITEAEWLAGEATVISALAGTTHAAAYIYLADGSKCGNFAIEAA